MRRDLADQRHVFFFYLAVISYVNSTCKVKKGKDVDDSCSPKLVSQRDLCPVLSSRPSPTSVYWLATSVFHFSLAISCGHTTDFYLGKPFLPRANSSKIYLGKFISGFVLPR